MCCIRQRLRRGAMPSALQLLPVGPDPFLRQDPLTRGLGVASVGLVLITAVDVYAAVTPTIRKETATPMELTPPRPSPGHRRRCTPSGGSSTDSRRSWRTSTRCASPTRAAATGGP